MTINEAVQRVDEMKPNIQSQEVKVGWLSTLDSMVKRLLIDTHEGGEGVSFCGYTPETDPDTVLLIPEPYEDAYLRWMEAQIDLANGEIRKYNNSVQVFQGVWDSYRNYYNRTHMPKGQNMKFF